MSIVIHHNPECGTSRNALEFLKQARANPIVIEYLKEGWTKPQLLALFAAADLTPKTALRVSKSPAEALGLLRDDVTDDEILEQMILHPVLVNRPIVASPKGVKLCRPSEMVFDLLDHLPKGPIRKEDGEMVIDDQGRRVG